MKQRVLEQFWNHFEKKKKTKNYFIWSQKHLLGNFMCYLLSSMIISFLFSSSSIFTRKRKTIYLWDYIWNWNIWPCGFLMEKLITYKTAVIHQCIVIYSNLLPWWKKWGVKKNKKRKSLNNVSVIYSCINITCIPIASFVAFFKNHHHCR